MSAEGTIRKLNSEGEREEERPFPSSHLAPRGYSFFSAGASAEERRAPN